MATAALFVLAALLCPPVAAMNGTPNVLVLHSYHPGFSWTDEEAEGVLDTLREEWPGCEPFIEYMDWKRHPGDQSIEFLRAHYRERYAPLSIDAVIATDNAAIDFALAYRAELFDDAPVAFCGLNGDPAMIVPQPDVAGVIEQNDPAGTLAIALQLHPDRKHVLVVLDDTESSLENRRATEVEAARLRDQAEVVITQNLSAGELAAAAAALPPDSLIVLGTFNRDREGQVLSTEQSLRLVRESTNMTIPVYSHWDVFSGTGIVGGHILAGRSQGREAAELAARLLHGERRIPIDVTPPLTWTFDHRELVRNGARLEALPPESVLLNRPVPLYEEYGSYLVAAGAVFAALIAIIALLAMNVRHRAEAGVWLLSANTELARAEREARQMLGELETSRAALHESEERYRNVVEDQTEFISRFSPDAIHVFVNEAYCRYFGLDRGAVIGRRFMPALPGEDRRRMAEHLASLTPEDPVGTILHRTIDEDGRVRWQRWTDRAIFDSQGRVTEYQSVGRDVTEQQRAELALSRAKAQLTLLSELSRNDLQNHVFTLRGYLGLALSEAGEGPALQDLLSRANDVAAQIARTIEFSRDFQGLGTSPARWQRLNEVFLYALSHLDIGPLERIGALDGVEVYADPLLEKVLGGLIENVVRHARGATRFELGWRETDKGLVVWVEDDGPGVPDDRKEQIFHRRPGSGRSLFLAREVLGITGIAIRENGVHGAGARFELVFPKGGYRLDTPRPGQES